MIYSIYPIKDTTIYEKYPYINVGIDSILDLSYTPKDVTSSYESRALLKFDLNSFPTESLPTSSQYYLNLYVSELNEIPYIYEIHVHPISSTWDMGIGKYDNIPTETEGCTWYNRNINDKWLTGSFPINTTASWNTNVGGGNWSTLSDLSQSYEYSASDVRINITDVVNLWKNNTIDNNGILIRYTKENNQVCLTTSSLKYFSKETHTIYSPKLEVCWDDSTYITPISKSLFDENSLYTLYIKNLEREYIKDDNVKIIITGREKYQQRTYATQSVYLTQSVLPSTSYYAVKDYKTEEFIIPFDTTYTKISYDNSNNYFKLKMQSLQPERYYRFLFRIDFENTSKIYDNDYIFKITR